MLQRAINHLKCSLIVCVLPSFLYMSCCGPNRVSKIYYPSDDSVQVLPPNSIIKNNALVLNTNFSVPIVRFNQHKDPALTSDNSKGSVALFNSIGAGIGVFTGQVTRVTDGNSNVIKTDFDNSFGLQVGFLFGANTEDGNRQDIFALTSELNLLNFQIGAGYEFGHTLPNQRRTFFTVAYGVSLSKLTRGGTYLLKNMKTRHKHDLTF